MIEQPLSVATLSVSSLSIMLESNGDEHTRVFSLMTTPNYTFDITQLTRPVLENRTCNCAGFQKKVMAYIMSLLDTISSLK